jgi:hypothetical protein
MTAIRRRPPPTAKVGGLGYRAGLLRKNLIMRTRLVEAPNAVSNRTAASKAASDYSISMASSNLSCRTTRSFLGPVRLAVNGEIMSIKGRNRIHMGPERRVRSNQCWRTPGTPGMIHPHDPSPHMIQASEE